MMNLRFSVITPSFSQGRFIERTIESVLAQQTPDIEIEYVVCDGGSTDETLDILKRYSDRIRWISEPDNGQADAVNKGIAMTAGEIIAWINSDDVYYPGTFAAVKAIFAANPDIQAVYGDADHIDECDRYLESYPTEPWDYQRLIEICFLCQPAVFFRRESFDKFGGLDATLKYCMDYELWLRYGQHISFYYLPRKLAGSRFYQDNKTLGQRIAVHREINDMFRRNYHRVPDKWIFAYGHIYTEETWKLDRSNSIENLKFAILVIYKSLWSFWHWKKLLSVKACVRMTWWLIAAQIFLIKTAIVSLSRSS